MQNAIQTSRRQWLTDLTWLLICLSLFYLLWLGSHPLLTPDEARYSEIAREMVAARDYITLRLNGVVFLDKPVLYYWLQASAIKLFGLNEWALRLWPALIGVIGCLFMYVSGRLLFNRRTGILAALILASAPLYFSMAHYANLDLEVAVFISSALLAFIIAMQQTAYKRTRWLLVAYSFSGLAVLTKGMIGMVLPGIIIGGWILLLNNWRIVKEMRLISGLVIVLLITLPWYWLVQKANPDFFSHFFLHEQFTRFLSKDFNNAQPFWFYLPLVLAGVMPWLVFLPAAIIYHYKLIKQNKKQHSTELFLLLWPALIFIFFSLPHSKTIGYIVSVIPPLTLLLGRYLDNHWDNFILGKLRIGWKLFITLFALIALTELVVLANSSAFNLQTVKPLALIINRLAKPEDEIVSYYKYYQDLPLYTQRQVTVVEHWDSPAIFQKDTWRREIANYFHSPAAHQWLITEPVFWQRWRSNKRLFVLVNQSEVETFEAKAKSNRYKIERYQDANLYTNKPY